MTARYFSSRRLQRTLCLLACTATATGLVACGGTSADTGAAGTTASKPAAGVIRVGSDLTYPPYAYLANGTPAGFDPDFVRALASQLDEKASFQDIRFEQLIPNLSSGRFDIIASALYITAERAKKVDYIPYLTTGNSIVARSDDTGMSSVSELCGKKVGVIKGAAVADSLRKESGGACEGAKPVDVSEFPTDPEATQALLARQVDAQVTDAAVAKTVVDKTSGKLAITSHELLYPIPVGLAVRKGDTALARRIRRGIAKLRESGAYQQLLKKYNLRPPVATQVAKILGS
jgi:polar amino acid transport system permease protein/polar amino acid transport system substrate-binding protein